MIASAKRIENTTSGSIALSAAARIGLTGINPVSHSLNVGSCLADSIATALSTRSAVTERGSMSIIEKRGGAARSASSAVPIRSARNSPSVRAPRRPTLLRSLTEATPPMSIATTSGTTVMRMALTHSSPIGTIHETAASNPGLPDAETRIPAISPATSDTSTRLVREIGLARRAKGAPKSPPPDTHASEIQRKRDSVVCFNCELQWAHGLRNVPRYS
jgi:hypothetical protein